MFRIPPKRPRQDAGSSALDKMQAVASGSNEEAGSTVNMKQVVHCSHVIVILLARTAACFLSGCCDFSSWLPRLDFQEPCMPSAMQAAVCQGVLVHGPLLGWAKMKGDQIFVYHQTMSSRDDTISYLMLRRHGLEFGLYPWHGHLKDAAKGTKNMLVALGEWHHLEPEVREVGLHKSWL